MSKNKSYENRSKSYVEKHRKKMKERNESIKTKRNEFYTMFLGLGGGKK